MVKEAPTAQISTFSVAWLHVGRVDVVAFPASQIIAGKPVTRWPLTQSEESPRVFAGFIDPGEIRPDPGASLSSMRELRLEQNW
jgi:hypothetical protein